jgi:hypothetical protein
MIFARRIGAIVLAVAAVAVWFLMAPAKPKAPVVHTQQSVSDQSAAISQALSDYEQNNALTQGAPQQAVVNGWAAKDLLTIIAKQQNEALTRPAVQAPLPPVMPEDDRVPALVGLLVLALALALATSPRPRSVETLRTSDSQDGAAFHPGAVQA